MEFLKRLLFEDLTMLLLSSVIALAIALAFHRRRYTTHSRRGVWLTLTMIVMMIALQKLVVTRTEALRDSVDQLVAAVNNGDLDAVETLLTHEVRFGTPVNGLDVPREAIVGMIELALTRYEIRQASIGRFEPEISGERAEVKFTVKCDIRGQTEGVNYNAPSVWTCRFAWQDDRWRLDQIINGQWGIEGFGPGTVSIMGRMRDWLGTAVTRQKPQ